MQKHHSLTNNDIISAPFPTPVQLRMLFNSSPDVFCLLDDAGNILQINQACYSLLGYLPQELIGLQYLNFVAEENISKTLVALKKVREQQQQTNFENYTLKKDGSFLPLSWSFFWDESEKITYGIARSAMERKLAEEELRRLSLVAQQTNNIVAISSPENKVVWVNAAFTRITGFTFEEAIGKNLSDVFDGPETDTETIKYVKEQFKKREPFQIEVINYKKNKDMYWADVSCQPVFDEMGNLQHFFSISTDVTERKKLQQVLDKEKKNRQKMITAAAIAAQEKERAHVGLELHDNVNQVLTTVKLYTEICRDGLGNTSEIMNKSIQLLQESINEIRNLSKRLSAPSLGNIKLKDSVKELVNTITATNKIAIELNTTAIEKLEVNKDIHLAIYRILQEHFTNILKYAQANMVTIVFEIQDNNIGVKITDDGKGFTTSDRRNGIGITNMVTRAESLNGILTLESAPGKGCQLLVLLPLL